MDGVSIDGLFVLFPDHSHISIYIIIYCLPIILANHIYHTAEPGHEYIGIVF